MSFVKYMHIEKLGTVEVENIELGRTYIFPKIDGTNASVWLDDGIQAGSRTRQLTLEADNAGFYQWILDQSHIHSFLDDNPNLRLYGEWLVPHTLTTYAADTWRQFYVFDVYNNETEQLLSYDAYKPILDKYGISYIPPLRIITNADSSMFMKCLAENKFLIKDGEGVGEGIVIKNYDYYNKFGRQTWAKIITNEFKTKHLHNDGVPETGCEPVELKIVQKYITKSLVDKVEAKIVVEMEGWSSKYIPRLLDTVFYDLIKEESWEFIKEYKNPIINYRALKAFSINRVKELKSELF